MFIFMTSYSTCCTCTCCYRNHYDAYSVVEVLEVSLLRLRVDEAEHLLEGLTSLHLLLCDPRLELLHCVVDVALHVLEDSDGTVLV